MACLRECPACLDRETERKIIGHNQHSVYHICPRPEHGTSCYAPLQNKCSECRLYLSGEDVRWLIDEAVMAEREAIIAEADEMAGQGPAGGRPGPNREASPAINYYAGWQGCGADIVKMIRKRNDL